jgi:hypothetical protein
MSTLWTFGCSYTDEYHPLTFSNGEPNNYTKFKEYRGGELPEVWPRRLAKFLNLECKNLGMGGSSNHQIFLEFCNHCNEFKENDIIVVGWTQLARFIIPRNVSPDTRGFTPVHPNGFENFNKKDIGLSVDTMAQMIVEKSNPLWATVIYDWQNLMVDFAKSKKFHIFFWSSDSKIIYDDIHKLKNQKNYLLTNAKGGVISHITNLGGKTIDRETKGVVQDYHLGDSGHQKQAELFYENIVHNLGLDKNKLL